MTAPTPRASRSLDIHDVAARAGRDLGKAIHRTLYNWDSAATSRCPSWPRRSTASADGLTHTYKLRDDAYFHNGRKMTADDIIWSFTRIMDGSKGYPGARYVRLIKGAVEVEKGQAKEISGLKKIDDFTLEMTMTDKVDPGFYFFDGTTVDPAQGRGREGQLRQPTRRARALQVQGAHPGLALRRRAVRQVLQARQALRRPVRGLIMAEAAARDVAFRNKEIDTSILGPAQYVAYRADPALSKGILEVAEMFTRSCA